MQRNSTKRLSIWAGAVATILMIPLLTKAPWTFGDYVFGAVVLFGSATVYELATKNMSNRTHRFAVGVAAAAVVILIWAAAVAD